MFSIQHLSTIRTSEIERIAGYLIPGARILEVGAGNGEQAAELARRGFSVTAIEISDSNYTDDRVFPILVYDGHHIPLPDASFDIVFSSNLLEHVRDLEQMHAEISRVLKPNGYCIHILPTHGWRFWTTLSSFPDAAVYLFVSLPNMLPHGLPSKAELERLAGAWFQCARSVSGRLYQRRHGERGTVISELWLFRPQWWRANFRGNGFVVVHDEPMGLFYTGNMLLGRHLSSGLRQRLSHVFGSACHLFKVVPAV